MRRSLYMSRQMEAVFLGVDGELEEFLEGEFVFVC